MKCSHTQIRLSYDIIAMADFSMLQQSGRYFVLSISRVKQLPSVSQIMYHWSKSARAIDKWIKQFSFFFSPCHHHSWHPLPSFLIVSVNLLHPFYKYPWISSSLFDFSLFPINHSPRIKKRITTTEKLSRKWLKYSFSTLTSSLQWFSRIKNARILALALSY